MSDVESQEGRTTRVAIAIPTCRRPSELERLLSVLVSSIVIAVQSGAARNVDVLVVDNDPAASARVVAEMSPIVSSYVLEPTPGVAAVRNRALDECESHDVVVFIDDDETPADSEWLVRLLAARLDHAAHVVSGPVVTISDTPLDPWIVAGGFFARRHRQSLRTGDSLERAASNNLLLDGEFLRSVGIRFDLRFGRTGGEDSLFTSELHRAGAHMVWCAEAVVIDHLPAERQSRRHALARTRGMAAAGSRVGLALAGSARRRAVVRARMAAVGAARLSAGAVGVLFARISRSDRLDALSRRSVARGIGTVEGMLGLTRAYYGPSTVEGTN